MNIIYNCKNKIDDYWKMNKLLKQEIKGPITLNELLLFFLLVGNIAKDTDIIEVGSYKGSSAIAMATGLSIGAKLYSIDIYIGLENKPEDTYQIFLQNIQRHNFNDIIVPFIGTSKEFVEHYNIRAGLIFIDGSHLYEDVKKDFDLLFPMLVKNGFLIMHDIHWDGPGRVFKENNDKFSESYKVDKKIGIGIKG